MSSIVTKDIIRQGLESLGLASGDTVLVHSSLSCFGNVEGGADTVVDALLEVLGGEGTLVVPTFTTGQGVFDPAQTPSIAGAITEAVRLRPNALRSLHPTHSVAAIGALADVIVEGHEKVHAFGRGSSFYRLLQARGKVLQLGTSHISNSMVHVAEEIAGLPYVDRSHPVDVVNSKGKVSHKWIRRPGCSYGFEAIEEPMQENGAITETMIGDCRARLMSARAVIDAAVELLKMSPEALLCERPECGACAEARAILAATEVEKQDREVIELAEQEEQTVRLIERQLGGSSLTYYETDPSDQSLN